MDYFNKFPLIAYEYNIGGVTTPLVITNMMVRLRMILANKLDINKITTDFIISDNENLESISYDLYNTPKYHWTILFINNLADYVGDFPLSQAALDMFIDEKYGDAKFDVHHYEDERGNVVDSTYIGNDGITVKTASPITNEEYEVQVNDKKRYIKVIHPNYMSMFITEFEKAMKSV